MCGVPVGTLRFSHMLAEHQATKAVLALTPITSFSPLESATVTFIATAMRIPISESTCAQVQDSTLDCSANEDQVFQPDHAKRYTDGSFVL